MKEIIVVPYNENWKKEFEKITGELYPVLKDFILSIEHVGSTSVEGMYAKPVIDLNIIIEDYNSFEMVKSKLEELGYIHKGELGIKDRHAFKYPDKPHLMKHHLYVCPKYSEELKRHIAFRDFLREHKEERDALSKVKILATKYYPHDIDSYLIVKGPWVMDIYEKCGLL